MLSRAAVAPVPVPGLDQAVHLTREELERVVTPLLRPGVYEAARVLRDSGVPREALAGLFLVGGSSRVPLVARLLHSELGIAPTVLEQPELPVAEGALAELTPPAAGSEAATAPPPGAPPRQAPAPPRPAATAPTQPAAAPLTPVTPVSDAGPGHTYGGHPAPYPGGPPPRRRAVAWIAAGAVLLVLVAATAVALYLRRGTQELAFRDVDQVARVRTGGDRPPYYTFTHVLGDTAYLAWQQEDRLEVIAVDTGSGEERWREFVPGRSEQWAGIRAFPHVVVVTSANVSSAEERPFFVLNPETGKEMWRRDVSGDDHFTVYRDVILFVDNKEDRLLGLDPSTGTVEWERDNPASQYGYTDATVAVAGTAEDLTGPADVFGFPYGPARTDHRVVQIGSDEKARVIDVRTKKVLRERGNVGETSAQYLVFEGQLFVAGTAGGYQILAYDLDTMGEPRSLYRSADGSRRLERLVACGPERLCLLDAASTSDAQVSVIDIVEARRLWWKDAPGADDVVPVGDRVLVSGRGSDEGWKLFDDDGNQVTEQEGKAVRLNAGNLLSFTGSYSTISADLSVGGIGPRSDEAVQLGPLKQARGETCSWNTEVIACMTENDFALWRFVED
jgi:hypothetical protein